jgi:CHASE3 domain sensor protein
MDKTFRLILLVFAILATSMVTEVVLSITNLQRANRSAQWVNHTHAFIAEINAAVTAGQRAESALHAFLLTNNPDQRAQMSQAFGELSEHIEVAKALAASEAESKSEVAELETALIARADIARALLAAHRSGDTDSIHQQLSEDDPTQIDALASLNRRIVSRHQGLLQQRDRVEFNRDNRTRNTLYVGAGLTLLLLLISSWFIRDDLKSRRREAALLAASNEELEARVAERTSELKQSNRKLRAENLESRWSAQALEHQLRYNNLIIESVASPVVVVTRALNISRVNPAFENLIGELAPALVDQSISEFVKLAIDESGDEMIDPFELSLRSNQDLVDHAANAIDHNHKSRPMLASLHPLRDHDRVVGGVITLRPSN